MITSANFVLRNSRTMYRKLALAVISGCWHIGPRELVNMLTGPSTEGAELNTNWTGHWIGSASTVLDAKVPGPLHILSKFKGVYWRIPEILNSIPVKTEYMRPSYERSRFLQTGTATRPPNASSLLYVTGLNHRTIIYLEVVYLRHAISNLIADTVLAV